MSSILILANQRMTVKALYTSTMSTGDHLYKNVAGIIFLGTPHRGFELAKFASNMGNFISLVGLGSVSPMLKQFKPNSEILQEVNMQFRQVLQKVPIEICSAFETRVLRGVGLVSERS